MKEWVKITDIERLNNTYVGNPRWRIHCETKDKLYTMTTKANASVGFKISSVMAGTAKFIKFHQTKSGNYIMDDIEV